jgi:hypothetical protein
MEGLHGLTPYEKLKGLPGEKTPKDFEVFNNLPVDKILNLDIVGNERGAIKDERVYIHPI